MDVKVLEQLSACGIMLLIFPPNCTPLLQQLDFKLFGFYKQDLRAEVSISNAANFAETISLHDLSALTFLPWTRTATPERIISAFKGTGVFPLDPTIPLSRMENSPSALVYDVPAALAAVANPLPLPPPLAAAPPTAALPSRKRPPPLGDLKADFPQGSQFKQAKLDYSDVTSNRKLSIHLDFFVEQNWEALRPHFQSAIAHQIDNIPDIPIFDNPENEPAPVYLRMGTHIDDILSVPRAPTFGKRKRSSWNLNGEDQSEESTGPRVPSFGIMTSPDIIRAKKEIKEKKIETEQLKKEKANIRKEGRAEREEKARLKKAAIDLVLEKEKPLRTQLIKNDLINTEEIIEIEKKPLPKPLLMALASQIGLRVKNNIQRPNLVELLLDDGYS